MKTKIAVVLLVLLSACCEAFFDTDFLLQRAKRQIRTHSEFRTLQCVGSCVTEFNGTMQTMKKGQGDILIQDELLDKPKLDEFCRNYERMDSCMRDCDASSSPVYRALEQMFELFNVICKSRYEEFVSYLPCFAKSRKLFQERCTDSCGDAEVFKQNLQAKMRTEITQYAGQPLKQYRTANTLLSNLCDFMSCQQRCQTRVFKETCQGKTGENAGKFMVTFTEQTIKAATTALKMIAPQITIPEGCLTREGPFSSLNQAEQREEDYSEDEDNFFF